MNVRRKIWIFTAMLVLIFVFVYPPIARADDDSVTAQEAYRVALAWLNSCPDFHQADVDIIYEPAKTVLELKADGQTYAYVLTLEPTGFIIVTPRHELKPIIAYSEHAKFDATDSPQNILLILLRSDILERIQVLEAGHIPAETQAEARAQWKILLSGEFPLKVAWDVEYGPFLTSTWGQGSYGGNYVFNYYTPYHYVCGCVATALGQILNYYEWPSTGTGAHSYLWYNGVDPAQTLSANFGATTYDWANILDNYATTTTETQREAVGKLVYHAGVAVDMNYASGGSGAATANVAAALPNYFRAAGTWVQNTGDFYDRLYANITRSRPAELAIRETGGAGHAVVVDGVRHDTGGTKYYHLNMGWWGTADAWYDITVPFSAGGYTWNTVSGAVLDIVPTPDMNDLGTTITVPSFPVSWNVSQHQNADYYELQQAFIPATLGSFSDGAESGTGNWAIVGNWEQSNFYPHSGSYTFKGYVAKTANDTVMLSLFTLKRHLKITPATTISYWWSTYYFDNTEARLEISTDGVSWTTLMTHTESNHSYPPVWHAETVPAGALAPYIGEIVALRFVIDAGNSWYYGSSVGFYLDDFSITNAYIGDEWTTVDNDITSTSATVNITQNGDYLYRVRPYAHGQWWNWSDVEKVTVLLPVDLALTHTVTPTVAQPGDTLTFTLIFSNAGPGVAINVVVTDILPVSVTNVTFSSSGDVTLTPRGGVTYIWDVSDMASGDNGIITITGQLAGSLPAGLLDVAAEIATTATDSTPANNSDTASVAVNGTPLTSSLTPATGWQDFGGGICGRVYFAAGGTLPTALNVTFIQNYPTANRDGLPRRYDITASGGSGYQAQLALCYADAELAIAGIAPADEPYLHAYHYNYGTHTWDEYSTVDTTNNVITTSTITEFGVWSIGMRGGSGPEDKPTALTLWNFAAHKNVLFVSLLSFISLSLVAVRRFRRRSSASR